MKWCSSKGDFVKPEHALRNHGDPAHAWRGSRSRQKRLGRGPYLIEVSAPLRRLLHPLLTPTQAWRALVLGLLNRPAACCNRLLPLILFALALLPALSRARLRVGETPAVNVLLVGVAIILRAGGAHSGLRSSF